jgi:hypothetical protein
VDVVAAAVGFDQQRIAREVREQAKFDLRIIGGEKNMAGLGGEGGANAASEFGADGMFCRLGFADDRRPVAVPAW